MAAPESHPITADRPAPSLPACRVRRVVQYIDDNLQNSIRLVELSALVHMSPYHFARLFKRSTRLPPHQFVVRRRIDRASALLITRELSIAAIARAVGFRGVSHFTTVFRRITGLTPGVYRVSSATSSRRPPRVTSALPAGVLTMKAPNDERSGRPCRDRRCGSRPRRCS